MYSRKEHAEKLATTFGFDCASCRAEILRDLNAPAIGAVVVAKRDDGLFRIWASTTLAPVQHVRRLSEETRREHTLLHSISVLDTRALEGHLRRRLDEYLDARRAWYELPSGVIEAVCSTKHLCEVPSPYLTGSGTIPAFSSYVRSIERAMQSAAA